VVLPFDEPLADVLAEAAVLVTPLAVCPAVSPTFCPALTAPFPALCPSDAASVTPSFPIALVSSPAALASCPAVFTSPPAVLVSFPTLFAAFPEACTDPLAAPVALPDTE
jgi:hypothetical protein